jgi:hypothetical protein
LNRFSQNLEKTLSSTNESQAKPSQELLLKEKEGNFTTRNHPTRSTQQ